MFNRNVPTTGSTEVAIAKAETGVVTKIEVTRAVGEGIKALQVAFPLVAQTPEDRKIVMGLYVEAVQEFDPAIAEYALKWLRLHNPRNTPTFTQPPTPQDVYECCKRIEGTWHSRVKVYFLGMSSGYSHGSVAPGTWEDREDSYLHAISKSKPIPFGPEPGTNGCYIPDRMVAKIMLGITGLDYKTSDLVELPADAYGRLRPEFFAPGRKEEIDGLRKAKADAEEKTRQHNAYLESLGEELKGARHKVMRRYWGRDAEPLPAEEEIIRLAKELLAQEAAEKARRDAEWAAELEAKRVKGGARTKARDAEPEAYQAALTEAITVGETAIAQFYRDRGLDGALGIEDYNAGRALRAKMAGVKG